MKTLIPAETILIAGGEGDENLTNPEKVEEIVQDGIDNIQDKFDNAIDKIHDAVHTHKVKSSN